MSPLQNIKLKLKELKPILEKEYGVDRIGYFGSLANKRFNENSDVDLLIHYNYTLGWKFFDLKDFLESKLNRKVDLVTEKSIKHQWKKEIMEQVKYI